MTSAHTKKIIRLCIYGLLCLLFLWAGMLYVRFEKGWIMGTLPDPLRSQVIEENPTITPKATLSRERILARIAQLEAEIVQETNDPDRAMELRVELQSMREELKKTEQ